MREKSTIVRSSSAAAGSICEDLRSSKVSPQRPEETAVSTAAAPPQIRPKDFLGIDHLLSDEERDMRDSVRAFVTKEIVPHVGDWFEEGEIPASELAPALGRLGVLGVHLEGYGCAGASATAHG